LLTGVSFFVTVLTLGPGPLALKWCLFEALALGLLFSDLEQRILPDEMTLGGAVAGILLSLVVPMEWGYAHLLTATGMSERSVSVIESLLGAILGSGLLWLIGFLYNAVRHKEGLGLGDVKMMAMIGSFMGLQGAMQTLILASLVGSVVGLLYIRLAKKDYSTYELPFGTFLGATAFLLALLRGPLSA
jgi:leader peptidase (prepilin peptidase) / N-methyltransferase